MDTTILRKISFWTGRISSVTQKQRPVKAEIQPVIDSCSPNCRRKTKMIRMTLFSQNLNRRITHLYSLCITTNISNPMILYSDEDAPSNDTSSHRSSATADRLFHEVLLQMHYHTTRPMRPNHPSYTPPKLIIVLYFKRWAHRCYHWRFWSAPDISCSTSSARCHVG